VIEPEVDRYLADLADALRRLPRRERERALREARDHLLCAVDTGELAGRARSESVRSAIAAFGPVEAVAAAHVRPPRTRPALLRAGSLAVAAAVSALAFAPAGSRLGQILIPTSHAAGTACAGRWNEAPRPTPYRLAWVSSPTPACEVVLHDGRRARLFRQDARNGRWHAIVQAGRSTWPLTRVPAVVQAHPYTVEPNGRLGRRIG
jgi:hypothetical protein